MSCRVHLSRPCRMSSVTVSCSHSGICFFFFFRATFWLAVHFSLSHVFTAGGRGIFYLRLTWHFHWAPPSNGSLNGLTQDSVNSVNLASQSRFFFPQRGTRAQRSGYRLSDKIIPLPEHLFLMCCAGGMRHRWIFMAVQKACMYHSDFHPCHQAMQMTSSHLHIWPRGPSSSLINDAKRMFFFPEN